MKKYHWFLVGAILVVLPSGSDATNSFVLSGVLLVAWIVFMIQDKRGQK
jgi:hypothetical protein